MTMLKAINEAGTAMAQASSAVLDPDKAVAGKLIGSGVVAASVKWLSFDVPTLIGYATLFFFALQCAWLIWKFYDKARARWRGEKYDEKE